MNRYKYQILSRFSVGYKIVLILLIAQFIAVNNFAQDTPHSCQDSKILQTFKKINSDVKKEFAPDSRDKVYEVELLKEEGKFVVSGRTTEQEAKKKLIDELKKNDIEVVDKILSLPDSQLNDKTYGVVCMSVASFNSNPSFSAESGTQALAGMPVTLLEQEDYWYRCINMEGYIAWVITTSVTKMTKSEYNAYLSMPKSIVSAPYSFVYSAPNTNSAIVSDLVLGCVVVNDEIITDNELYDNFYEETYYQNLRNGYNLSPNRKDLKPANGWTRVHLTDGRAGYVKSSDLENFDTWVNKAIPTEQNIVETAKKFLGFPYVWGGTSIKGIDCSGLSKTCYYLNGYVLRRDASQQVKTGDAVNIDKWVNGERTLESLSNLRPGDLLFFGRRATKERGERITHVAVYMGDGKIIHSSNIVRINSLIKDQENYYSGATNLLHARRIIGNADCDKGVYSVKEMMTKVAQ